MDAWVVLLTLVLVAGVLIVISAPLRARAAERRGVAIEGEKTKPESELAALEAAREAKYREIRDAELDYRTGKLSREDYEAVDAGLRREAIAILNSLERAQAPAGDRLEG